MIYSFERELILKRAPTVVDRNYEIQAWDVDNLYPLRADEARKRSYTTKSAVDRLCEFIDGEGFADPILSNLIFNAAGDTGNDILDALALDKSFLNAFAFHFSYDLNFKITEITPIEASFCRFGLPDEDGNVCEIKYNNNWERDYNKTINNVWKIETYPVFNPDPQVVQAQMIEYGFECYPGQILFWTPKAGIYPLAPFDSVLDQAQSQSEIGVFEVSSIQNDFTAGTILKYPGRFENNEEKRVFKKGLQQHKGARGAKSIMVIETGDLPPGTTLTENIQLQNTDKMFEVTSKNVKNAIRESMAMPAPLLGQLPEAGMFNAEQMQDSYTYANSMTRGHRNQVSRLFKKIMMYWKVPLNITSYEIIEQTYGPKPVTPAAVPGSAPVVEPEFNSNLASLTGKQSQNLRRIQRQFDQNKITKNQALAELKLSFGLNDAQALSLLDEDETNDAIAV